MDKKMMVEDVLNSRGRVKIIRILAEQGELNISKIAELAELNHSTTISHLGALEKAELVEKKEFGRIKIYKFKNTHVRAQALKHLIEVWNGGEVTDAKNK